MPWGYGITGTGSSGDAQVDTPANQPDTIGGANSTGSSFWSVLEGLGGAFVGGLGQGLGQGQGPVWGNAGGVPNQNGQTYQGSAQGTTGSVTDSATLAKYLPIALIVGGIVLIVIVASKK